MKPSCSPMTSTSASPTGSPARVGTRRAVILKKGPKVLVSSVRPRRFAAAAISSRVTMGSAFDDAEHCDARLKSPRRGAGCGAVQRTHRAAACATIGVAVTESDSVLTCLC